MFPMKLVEFLSRKEENQHYAADWFRHPTMISSLSVFEKVNPNTCIQPSEVKFFL